MKQPEIVASASVGRAPAQGKPLMAMRRGLIAAAILALTIPVAPAFAHEDYDRHARDHWEHREAHRDLGRAHERAHDQGFDNRWEHRAYHRALRGSHEDFHENHPGTRHDHYEWLR